MPEEIGRGIKKGIFESFIRAVPLRASCCRVSGTQKPKTCSLDIGSQYSNKLGKLFSLVAPISPSENDENDCYLPLFPENTLSFNAF